MSQSILHPLSDVKCSFLIHSKHVLFFNNVYSRYGKINCSSVFLNFESGIHSSISFPACLNDLQLAGEVQSDTKSTSDPLHLIFSCLPKSSGTNH